MRITPRARGYAALVVAAALTLAGIGAAEGASHRALTHPVSNGYDHGPDGNPSPSAS